MIELDPTSATPVFEQVREQVAALARVGALAPGHRLPSIRQLAADLRLAPGTVARAYAELELGGVIRTGRSGAFVAEGSRAEPALTEAAAELARRARRTGLSLDDAVAALRASWTSAGEPA